jgi:SnoaL-like domain
MPVGRNRQFFSSAGKHRTLRAALAVMAAVGLSSGIVGVAHADSGALLCGYSTPAADSGPEVDAIKQLKASYFANVDAKNWDGLRDLLAPDVVVDTVCSVGPVLAGRDPFIAFLELTLGAVETHHKGYDGHVHLTSATSAEALWTMDDVLIFGGTLGVHGYGHYSDRYVKVNGSWVVEYSKLTRTRFDLIKPDGTVIEANAPLEKVVALVKDALGEPSR